MAENLPINATVFIVDDDPGVTESIAELVELIGYTPRTFRTAEEFLAEYVPAGPSCLVLDIRMPGISGLELQKRLQQRHDSPPVIMITAHGDVRMAVQAVKAGATEFLEKPFRTQELSDAINKAIGQDIENWRRRQHEAQLAVQLNRLTAAERQVMELVLAGKTNQMIAGDLNLSVRAIEDRRARMMRKLGVTTRAELIDLFAHKPLAPSE